VRFAFITADPMIPGAFELFLGLTDFTERQPLDLSQSGKNMVPSSNSSWIAR
jgi:hypothetical protein